MRQHWRSEEDALIEKQTSQAVDALFGLMTDRYATVIRRRVGFTEGPATYRGLGDELGVTPHRVRQMYFKGLSTMRKKLLTVGIKSMAGFERGPRQGAAAMLAVVEAHKMLTTKQAKKKEPTPQQIADAEAKAKLELLRRHYYVSILLRNGEGAGRQLIEAGSHGEAAYKYANRSAFFHDQIIGKGPWMLKASGNGFATKVAVGRNGDGGFSVVKVYS